MSRPVYENVQHAPFKIGELVRIHRLADDTANRLLLGKCGTVEYFEYTCGCGQSYPTDPMIGVRFSERIVEEFWREELEQVSPFKDSKGGCDSEEQ